ncbi:MAG TPA: protein kinase, partial [Polyangiales bacterium]|nr:protein kinase [Polyangiales bacterium]
MRLCRLCKRLFSDDRVSCPDDKSGTVEAALEPLPGELLQRFPEREPLAQGATGTLYLIDRPGSIEDQLGPQLVLKVLAADLTVDPAERARHRRDLRKQQGLIHAQLPAVLEEGEVDGRVWFTRQYVPATSLAVRLHQSGAFALDAAISLIVQLSAALDGLHQLGLVHRDLKPGHVLLRAGQPLRVQLIDATLASPLVADNNARRGTPDYAAKEIIEGASNTARSDLYALGCLSYELIAGVPPFRRGSEGSVDTQATLAAQRNFEPKALPDLVPPVVRSAIASMLSKDARRRPFSAQQVRRSVEPLLAPVKPPARSGSPSALQREAAALRLTGPTAKPVVPTSYPDATVELDVKDLDEAIQASEEQDKRAGAAAKRAGSVDDDAPTIALQSPPPSAAPRSGVTATHNAERSGAVASAGGTNPYPPVTAQDLERLDQESARKSVPARGEATQRTHVPSDDAPEPTSTIDAAFDTEPEPRPRKRTGT